MRDRYKVALTIAPKMATGEADASRKSDPSGEAAGRAAGRSQCRRKPSIR
jgi:hypothetical protein